MSHSRRRWWGLAILLLPLALMGLTSLQSWRAESVLYDAQVMREWIANPSDELLTKLPFEERELVITDSHRRASYQYEADQAAADEVGLHLREVLAGLGYWLAFAALLAGPVTWLKLRIDARRALASRDFLYEHLASSWQTLGHWLVAYTALVAGSLALVVLYQLSWGWSHSKDGGWLMLLVCIPLMVGVYWGVLLIGRLRHQWHSQDVPSSAFLGRALSRADAPGLWAWVEQLAAHIGAPVPDHIVVGVDQSFFVTSVQVELQPSQQLLTGRTLYLPLTYLSAMSQEETASIIGHELGHFSSRDTERGSQVGARFSLMCMHFSIISAEDANPPWIERPAIWMTEQFLHHFQVAVHHWSRAQELVADRAGAQLAGERMFCQALLRVIALNGEINQLLNERRRDDLIQALGEHLQQVPVRLNEAVLDSAIAHPFDSHPPTVQRLQQLNVLMDAQLLAAATRAPTDVDRQWFGQLVSSPRPATTTSTLES